MTTQIEMLEETIDKAKAIEIKKAKAVEAAAKKAAAKVAKKAAEAAATVAEAAFRAEKKAQNVRALLAFAQKYGSENWDGENGKGETLTVWAERVC